MGAIEDKARIEIGMAPANFAGHAAANMDGNLTFLNGVWAEIVDINDYPQTVRFHMMNKEVQMQIRELFEGVAITNKGVHIAPGAKAGVEMQRLHLLVESESQMDVKRCVTEIRRVLEQQTLRLANSTSHTSASAIASR